MVISSIVKIIYRLVSMVISSIIVKIIFAEKIAFENVIVDIKCNNIGILKVSSTFSGIIFLQYNN